MKKFKFSLLSLIVFSMAQNALAETTQPQVQFSPDAKSVAMIVDNKPVFYQARDVNAPYGQSLNALPSVPNKASDIPTNNGKSTTSIPSQWSDEFAQYGILMDDEIDLEAFFSEINDNPYEKEKMPPSLADVLSYDMKDDLKAQIEEERYRQINDNAVSYGMQAGYAYQLAVIRLALNDRSLALDNMYNFTRFLMQGRILPPVITLVENRVQQTDDDTIHVGLHNYKILSDARLVTQAPNWRSYLLYAVDAPQRPKFSLNPDLKAEKELWNKAVAKGYQRGVMLANRNLYESWLQLQRDYLGIINYYELLYRGVVSKPYMTVSTQDITGDSRNMTIGDAVLRISVKPEFIMDRNQWQPNTRKGQKGYLGGRGDGAEVGVYAKEVSAKKAVKPKAKITKKVVTPKVDEPVKTETPVADNAQKPVVEQKTAVETTTENPPAETKTQNSPIHNENVEK